MHKLRELLAAVRGREEGATMAEYAVVLSAVTVTAVGVFIGLSGGIRAAVNSAVAIFA